MSTGALNRLRTGEIALSRPELDSRWKKRVEGIPTDDRNNWRDPDNEPFSKQASDYHPDSWQHHLLKARLENRPYEQTTPPRKSHWRLVAEQTQQLKSA